MKYLAAAGALALAAGTPAFAVQFTGGNVSLGYSQMLDSSSLARTGVTGQAEMGITPEFSIQGDVGVSKFLDLGETEHNATVHGIWHNGTADLGVFYGVERLDESRDFYGFELGQKTDSWSAELYLGRGENADWDGGIAGISGKAWITPAFGMGLSYDAVNIDGIDAKKVAVTADYMVTPQMSLGAELGTFDSDIDEANGNEGFVGVNATLHFGATGGTTFGRRGVLNIIPGL